MKRLFRSKVAWGIAIATAAALGVFGYHQANAGVIQDCSPNSIIKCGVQTPSAFATKAASNNPRDLQAVFSHFNLVPSEYAKFAAYAKEGMAYRDGTIRVNGRIVATEAWSIGRSNFSYSSPMNIAGHKYYYSANKRVLKQDLPVMVLFDSKGVMQFAVMKACGNPTTGKKVVPSYRCDLLQKSEVQGQKNTYSFTTKATATGGAQLSKVVYNFGDGSAPVTKTSLTDAVTHTYTQAGTYTAKVTVYVKLPGGNEVPVTGVNCAIQITVKAPPVVAYTCDSLQALPSKENELEYTFQANTSSQNATLTGADFDFGDGTSAPNVAPGSNANVVTVDHTYAKPGNYTAKATVHFEVEGEDGQKTVKSVNCETPLNTAVCPYNPELPPNSPQCEPCPYNPELPKDSPKCAKPVVEKLPDAGASDVLGIFAAASLAGFVAYRFYLSRKLIRE